MGGFFGAVSENDCIADVFFGTDYHSHLGTRRAGMAVYGENGLDIARQAYYNVYKKEIRYTLICLCMV